jgi:hypothetical protein
VPLEDLEDRRKDTLSRRCGQGLVKCCALHNWLLSIDGLSEEWEQGVAIIFSD